MYLSKNYRTKVVLNDSNIQYLNKRQNHGLLDKPVFGFKSYNSMGIVFDAHNVASEIKKSDIFRWNDNLPFDQFLSFEIQ